MLAPQLLQKPALTFVGMETPFISGLSKDTNASKVIPPLWDEQFIRRVNEIPNRVGTAAYGVMYVKPKAHRSHPEELQYIAAVTVSSADRLPEGMVSRIVPATTFAVFLHRGPIRTIVDTCYQIYRVWLPQSAYEHSGIADIEVYDHRFDANSETSEMEYWISVKPKAVS